MLAVTLLALMVWAASAPAGDTQEMDVDTSPKVAAYLSHAALGSGDTGRVLAIMRIPDLFHVQQNIFLEMLVPEDAPITLGALSAPGNAEWDGEPVLKGEAQLTASFTVKDAAAPGVARFVLSVGFQGCSEGPVYACYPPEEVQIPLTLEVLPAGAAPRPANEEIFAAHAPGGAAETHAAAAAPVASEKRDLAARLRDALARGSFLAFLLVFLGGVISSLTPCVYPMIPITISFVGGRAKSRLEGFILALFFVLGLAIMYSVLGLVAASTGAVFGSAMQSPVALGVVAFIFAAMGASMLGAFDLALPSGLTTKMTSASSGAGARGGGAGAMLGAILMGMTTGLVASPCVGPVLVVLLTFVAESGNLLHGFWLLFTFACGLGLLFLVLGTFAGAISALPAAGSWMNTVKHVFGVILIAMAIFYLRSLMGPGLTRFVLGTYLILVGVFTGAFTPLPHQPPHGQLWRKAVGILIFLSGAVLFIGWLLTAAGMPLAGGLTAHGTRPMAGHLEPEWLINDEAALEEARAAGRPVVQDFYADWCAACVELDEKTWNDAAVLAEMERFTAIKMDFTRRGEYEKRALAQYEVRGMPTVILYGSDGSEATRFFGFKPPSEVLTILRSIR